MATNRDNDGEGIETTEGGKWRDICGSGRELFAAIKGDRCVGGLSGRFALANADCGHRGLSVRNDCRIIAAGAHVAEVRRKGNRRGVRRSQMRYNAEGVVHATAK